MNCARWTAKQDTLVMKMAGRPDAVVAAAVSKIGPARSASAIGTRRRDLKFWADHPDRVPDYMRADTEGSVPSGNGFPRIRGNQEDRDKRFVRALLNAQLAAVRAAEQDNSRMAAE